MINVKSKVGLMLSVLLFVIDVWIDGGIVDKVFDSAQILSCAFFAFGLICKVERISLWSKCDKYFKSIIAEKKKKKSGHPQQKA